MNRSLAQTDSPQLLISVNSLAEALIVAEYPVPIIDIKEPDHGSLGRASNETIAEICMALQADPRCRLSIALGEMADVDGSNVQLPVNSLRDVCAVDYVKFGLAGMPGLKNWRHRFLEVIQSVSRNVSAVAVIYADHQLCNSPIPEDIVRLAVQSGCTGVLFDTCFKNRPESGSLFDWLDPHEINRIVTPARAAGLFVAVAGSLGIGDITTALKCAPDVIGFRGAVCHEQRRHLDEDRLIELLSEFASQSASGSRFRNLCQAPRSRD
ncbi:MAG: (5-formylfuran-3-yl)methyl phosphate synthase [Planctomycetota bacterium]